MMELELTDDGVEVGGVKCSDNVSIFTLFHLNLEIVIIKLYDWQAKVKEPTHHKANSQVLPVLMTTNNLVLAKL